MDFPCRSTFQLEKKTLQVGEWVGRPRKAVMPGIGCEYHGAAWNPEEFDFTGSIQTNFGSHLSIIPPAIRL